MRYIATRPRAERLGCNDLPLMLSVPDSVNVLGISRAGAYELVKSEGFPSLHIGNRVLVPKEALIAWIKENTKGGQG